MQGKQSYKMADVVNFSEDFLASHDVHLILGDFNFDLLSKTSKQTGKSFAKINIRAAHIWGN